jgi:hypothetical protein
VKDAVINGCLVETKNPLSALNVKVLTGTNHEKGKNSPIGNNLLVGYQKLFKEHLTEFKKERGDYSKMVDEKGIEKGISQIDGAKATAIAKKYLDDNFGNVGMLHYRIEDLTKNGEETQFYVICSLLSAFGSQERLYYKIKVNIKDGAILEVWKSAPTKEDEKEITLTRVKFKEA